MGYFKISIIIFFIGFVPSLIANSIYFNSDYSSWESELQQLKFNGIAKANELVDKYNSLSRFNDIQYDFSMNGSYELFEGLNANLGLGLTFYKFIFFDELEDKDNSSYSIISNTPGYFANIGFSYNYSLTDAIELNILPEFRYYIYSNSTKQENIDDGLDEYNIDISKNMMSWRVPVVISYNYEFFIPFAGVSYSDFVYDLNYKSTTEDVFGNVDDSESEYTFSKMSKLNIVLGAKYNINSYIGIIVRAEFLKGYNLNLNFTTNL